ncbi:MAG TPA: alpha-hydroxy acid oxidase [Solirubrobacteraceae bacterium]|nr:alpha-hydroxy acid oxidase [Solirubrobacteraceae bacterium]
MPGLELDLQSLADVRAAAEPVLSERARAYINGGAADETTLADNEAAWSRLALAPRMLTGVTDPDPAVTLLGRRRPHPLLIAPTGFAGLVRPDADVAIARAAAATGTIICLSTFATTPPAELAVQVPEAPRWFQLYVFRDRGATRALIAAAEAHGYGALVLTVDRPVLGVRERERRIGVRADPELGTIGSPVPVDTSTRVDGSLTWADLERFAADTELPVLVKGVLTAHDARLAAERGAAGVIVSNHGGRQLDTTLSGADALPEVVDAVGSELDVLVDGGIRRGTDVVKALALGARAVLVGRPLLWGIAVGGQDGARLVLDLLLDELRIALALTGAASVDELDASVVRPAPWAGR